VFCFEKKNNEKKREYRYKMINKRERECMYSVIQISKEEEDEKEKKGMHGH